MNMKNDTTAITAEIERITNDFRAAFGPLSETQLNWKPRPGGWSIAQCLDHLIKSNDEVKPAIEAKINGGKNSFWEQWSPLTGFFGNFLKNGLASDKRKFKAPSKDIVPPSEIQTGIVDRFAENQAVVISDINAMGDLDWDKTVITSPFLRLMTYRLRDGVGILIEHEKRHFRQAQRVTETDGFPNDPN